MIDFTLTDDQKSLRELAHEFARREIRPVAWEYDRDSTWPRDIITKAHEIGLMNTHIPERYGGVGLSALEGCLIGEELAWGCSGIASSLGANRLAGVPVLLAGTEEVRREYFGELLWEPILAAFCLTEPDAGSDVAGLRTRAVRKRDKYVITGSKSFITNGRVRRLVHRLRQDRP
jgi:acyl-CoA dehydrogenase